MKDFGKDDFKITVQYEARLNERATIGNDTGENNKNEVYIAYDNNPSDTDNPLNGNSVKDTVYFKSTGFHVKKVDGASKDELSGAHFELLNEDQKTCDFVKIDDGKYRLYNGKELQGTTEVEHVKDLEVSETGKLWIHGFGEGTYYLKETTAPKGYNLLKEPIRIDVIAKYKNRGEKNEEFEKFEYKINGKSYAVTDEKGIMDLDVANNSGVELPSTGGRGTILLYAIGILAMAGGVCYFVMMKKRKGNNHQ